MGQHQITPTGIGHERSYESKAYEFGDPFNLDLHRTIRNALRRQGTGTPVRLSPDDFEIELTENITRSSTVLMLDLSLSMPMRDNFLSAKKVAMALHSLISSQFPRDYLGIVGFSEVARILKPEQLPEVSWDFVYGTNMQHAFLLSRQLLAKQSGTKQIIMITDGEPTAHIDRDGDVFFNYPPVPETIEATLREVARCTRDGHPHQHVHARRHQLPQGLRRAPHTDEPGPGLLHDARDARRLRPRRLHRAQAPAVGQGSPSRLTEPWASAPPRRHPSAGATIISNAVRSRQTGAVEDGGFGELYRRHYRPLLGMATALLASRERAEEVVQEAFATTFDHYRRVDDPVRATRRSVLRGCAAHKPSPVDATRGTQRILSRVRGLPRAERDAVALRHSLGLDAPEIDHALGLEPGTAALRLHEAGTKLRASLEVGDDLDRTLTTAFAETTAALGHVLARPGEAQRRVYHRRRVRVAVGATAVVVVAAVAAVLLSRGPSDENVTTGSDGTEAPTSDSARIHRCPHVVERRHHDRRDHRVDRGDRDDRGRHAPRGDLHRGLGRRVVRDRREAGRPRRQPPPGQRGDVDDPARRGPGAQGPAEAHHLTGHLTGHATRSPLRRKARWWRMTPL